MAFVERAPRLSEQELEALTRAGTWYANYFAREIAAEASETAAYAVEERRAYLTLVSALRTLGLRYAVPDELAEHAAEAA
jgi:hypothetical protein